MTGFPFSLWRGGQVRKAARRLYEGLLKAALAPELYEAGLGVDTFEGRSAMVTVHAGLLVQRLRAIPGREAKQLAERVNRLILDGFDAAYREKGVGDASIARKMRRLAGEHSGLGRSLMAALEAGAVERETEIAGVLKRNAVTQPGNEARLAAHLCAMLERLTAAPDADILDGKIDWTALR